jgi:hypothetical protein
MDVEFDDYAPRVVRHVVGDGDHGRAHPRPREADVADTAVLATVTIGPNRRFS